MNQTDFTGDDLAKLHSECQALSSENLRLKQNLQTFTLEMFRNDNEKVRIFTGLQNFRVMVAILQQIQPLLNQRSTLHPFKQFLLTCMELKLGVSMPYLAQIFDVHPSTISRTFINTLDIMNKHVVPLLLFWPERDTLRKTMPLIFRPDYATCVCIVDCFEIFIKKPKDLKARALTYSSYKSHNTMKCLIGIAPNGMITFISKGWGGRATDKHVVEQCGIMEKFLRGDSLMVDRGFPISDVLALYGISLSIPPFTRGKKQLSPLDLERCRQISALRIHVERVIGLVRKKYAILRSTIPVSLLYHPKETSFTTLDKIVRIACALCNTAPPIVPSD